MKKVIKKSILMVALLTTILSNANQGLTPIANKEVVKTGLTLVNVKKGQQLRVKDVNGIVLHKELIKKTETSSKGFNLTSLPNGYYYYELEKDFEIKTIPFKVISSEVIFNKEKELTIFKPVVKIKDNLVLISRLSLNEKPLELTIYYVNNGDFIFSEKFENEKSIERVYNFSKSRKGAYKIVFKTEGREFIETIRI